MIPSRKWWLTVIAFISFLWVWMGTQAYAGLSEPRRFRLNNGLTVVIQENHSMPIAAIQVWVKAGSTYEIDSEAGITHFIEHMIFKGTEKYRPGEVARKIESLGGEINAFTSFDYTVYQLVIESNFLESGADILSDAVLRPSFDSSEIEREKKVILEEIRMRKDKPGVRLLEEVMAEAYTGSPYKRPVIGYVETISKLTRDSLLTFVKKYYVPSNVAVVIVGDVKTSACLALIERKFSQIQGVESQTIPFLEAESDHIRTRIINDDIEQLRMAVCFPIPGFSHPDTPALDVLACIMGGGESSRLYQKMRAEKTLAHDISASAFTPRGSGLFTVEVILSPEQSHETLVTALKEFHRLKYENVRPDELARAKLNIESEFIYSLEKVEGQARKIGYFEIMAGDFREQSNYLRKVSGVTAQDIREVAKRYFQSRQMIVGLICPSKAGIDLSQAKIASLSQAAEEETESSFRKEQQPVNAVIKHELPNGITLLIKEAPSLPIVSVNAVFLGGLRAEIKETNGTFNAIAMLWKKGTKNKTAGEIASEIEGMAGKIEGFSGKNTFGLGANFLSRFFPRGMDLLGELIINPAFNEEELDRLRPVLLARLKEQEDNLISYTFVNLNKILFSGHPYALNPLGNEDSINGFSAERLKAVYTRYASPKNLVLAIVGDVSASQVRKQVEKIFSAWTGGDNFAIVPGKPDSISSPRQVSVAKTRQQTHVAIAFPGVSLYDTDRPALDVLNMVLTGQGGRLFFELRDKESLAYNVSAFSTEGMETGAFGVYIATRPETQDRAVQSLWRELERVRNEEISEGELERSKNHIIGTTQARLQTYASQAMDLSLNERYGLGYDFTEKYIKQVKKVTSRDVRQAARKYLEKEKHVLIKVGPANPSHSEQKH